MKNVSSWMLLVVFLFCLVTPAAADLLLPDNSPFAVNPQTLLNSGEATEEAWLEALLGLTYDDSSVEFIGRDEVGDPLDDVPGVWAYAVLKYGNGGTDDSSHWAVADDGDFILTLGDMCGLPDFNLLSHVSYFSGSVSVPEPSAMVLLGLGVVGLAGFGRKKLKK